MELEWDRAKAGRNLRKHGVAFEEAATVFGDSFELCIYDPDHSVMEERFVSGNGCDRSAAGRRLYRSRA